MEPDECLRRVKQWLLRGRNIRADAAMGRRAHVVDERPRLYRAMTDAELEAIASDPGRVP